jgi:hypothetical protein
MQFVLMIYQGTTPLPNTDAWEALSRDEQHAIYAEYAELNRTPGLESGPPLGLPEDATTVRVDGGTPVVTDGPFVDVKGAVGGFAVLEAEDHAAAHEVAAEVTAARLGGAVLVRPEAWYR